jgi:hypothetical protein
MKSPETQDWIQIQSMQTYKARPTSSTTTSSFIPRPKPMAEPLLMPIPTNDLPITGVKLMILAVCKSSSLASDAIDIESLDLELATVSDPNRPRTAAVESENEPAPECPLSIEKL